MEFLRNNKNNKGKCFAVNPSINPTVGACPFFFKNKGGTMKEELRINERVRFYSINEYAGKEEELIGEIRGDSEEVRKRYPEEYGEIEDGFYLVRVDNRSGYFVIRRDDVLEVLAPEEEILPDDYDEKQEDDEEFEEHERQVFEDLDKPKLKIIGADGNVFNILGLASRAGKRAGWSKEKLDGFLADCMSGDYNHVLATCAEHFEVT